MKKYGNSSYWLQDWDDSDIVTDTMNVLEKKTHDVYKLAAAKRAISNFVNIVTNQQIPVVFNTRGESYTDGKTVVIGSQVVNPADFDVAVGLALHEGSHIKLSDFTLLNQIYNIVPAHIKDAAIEKNIFDAITVIKNIWNYVEDRRIDNFIFTSAPGYRDYYRAMYDKYFNDSLIDKGLTSNEYIEENLDSYMFRIINLHNKNTNLSKLKGLSEIYKLIGLKTIDRLKNSKDTFEVSLQVFQVILNNLPTGSAEEQETSQGNDDGQPQNSGQQDSQSTGQSREMTDEEFEDFSEQIAGKSPMTGDMDAESNGDSSLEAPMPPNSPTPNDNSTNGGKSNNAKEVHLSDRQKELLRKKIEKQKDFLNGKSVTKKTISKTDANNLNAIEESGSELKSVGNGVEAFYNGNHIQKGVECVVVRNLTKSMFESELFPMTYLNYRNTDSDNIVHMHYQTEVDTGIRIGTILGKKLQIRGEDKNTIFNRQKVGKIDRRMLSSLGFGNENVFQYMETDSYKKANLHVSIDASGSMGGGKWSQTLINVVALCKAVDMISNLSIQVTFRTTQNNKPYIVMAYDSRKDKFSKVKKFFPGLQPTGTTPEGLCYEAIMHEFLAANNDMDSYFLNISDGEPYFSNSGFSYIGIPAFKHTAKMVKKIEAMGIKTLSYYVEEGRYSDSSEPTSGFKMMYGNSSRVIDVTNVSQITKTMNQLFLQK